MARIAALGEWRSIQPLAIAGAEPHQAEDDEQARTEWKALSSDVAVLVLSKAAAAALRDRLDERRDLLVTVLP